LKNSRNWNGVFANGQILIRIFSVIQRKTAGAEKAGQQDRRLKTDQTLITGNGALRYG
jgi:hypothetical protein